MKPALALLLGLGLFACTDNAPNSSARIIDATGPNASWGKTLGDVDGDGRLDIVVGGHGSPRLSLWHRVLIKVGLADAPPASSLVWYRNPDWRKTLITRDYHIRTDLAVGDINGDGANDLVLLTDAGLVWLAGPDFVPHKLDETKWHDVELADFDHDGRLDIALRNQTLFGYNNGNEVVLLFQTSANQWKPHRLAIGHGEGLAVADLNNDDYADLVVNSIYLQNPGGTGGEWQPVNYAPDWTWQDVCIATADINNDGYTDIIQSPSEPTAAIYRMSWFESPGATNAGWREHVIEADIETVRHSAGAGDFDGDGDVDIFTAEMNQGTDPDEVLVYLNSNAGQDWQRQVLDTVGSHGLQVADLDSDFDVELVGANWQFEETQSDYAVRLWDGPKGAPRWQQHVIPGFTGRRNLFVHVADVNNDAWPDIVAGPGWYRNPHSWSQQWSQSLIGDAAGNAVLLEDFDRDGNIDVLATRWDGRFSRPGLFERAIAKFNGKGFPGSAPGNEFVVARNRGDGLFDISANIASADGDFLQGISGLSINGLPYIALSWHAVDNGVQAFAIPERPFSDHWAWSRLSDYSQDEQLSAADINADGITDLVTGTAWLNGRADWQMSPITSNELTPDRNIVVDMNNDGLLDVVVGSEATSKPGKLVWYEQLPDSAAQLWREHLVGNPIGPMSLGIADMDADDDLDIVIGEHHLTDPSLARVIIYTNEQAGRIWRPQLVGSGDEHHDGLEIVDLDHDGDLDIVSIGWSHSNILIYQNLNQ